LEQDYEVSKKVLGEGVSGSVLLATAIRGMKQRVAVKAFDLSKLTSSQTNLLYSEIEVYLCMDHPHVTRLLDVYETDSKMSLVMECAEGGELFNRVAKLKCFNEKSAADATRQMLLAVHYLHSHGMVHRDLKLENFVYDMQGGNTLKMIDFGFSKHVNRRGRMNTSCGTLAYVAPEVLNRCYTSQCDLWSLGVIVFILLSGKMPFKGSSKTQMKAIRQGKFEFESKSWKGVSQLAVEFVESLLEVDPSKRLDSKAALEHRWITETCCDQKAHVDDSVVNAIHSWCVAPKMQRLCMAMVAWALTTEQCAAVQEDFLALDHDHDGTISLMELKKLATGQMSAHMLQQIADALAGSEIRYSDFLAAIALSRQIHLTDDLLRGTFEKFDIEGSGYITSLDLRRIIGSTFEGTEVEALIYEADDDKDGKLDVQEFIHHARKHPPIRAISFAFADVGAEAIPQRPDDYLPSHPAARIVHSGQSEVNWEEKIEIFEAWSPKKKSACEPVCAVQ
jgi:calcium-dependent protein kinase